MWTVWGTGLREHYSKEIFQKNLKTYLFSENQFSLNCASVSYLLIYLAQWVCCCSMDISELYRLSSPSSSSLLFFSTYYLTMKKFWWGGGLILFYYYFCCCCSFNLPLVIIPGLGYCQCTTSSLIKIKTCVLYVAKRSMLLVLVWLQSAATEVCLLLLPFFMTISQ